MWSRQAPYLIPMSTLSDPTQARCLIATARCVERSRSARRRDRRCGESRAAVAVPVLLDAVPAGDIAVHRRHVPEQASVRAVAQQMAAHLDFVTGPDIFSRDPNLRQAG